MDALVRDNNLGLTERLAVGMKRMIFAGRNKDVATVKETMAELSRVLPQTPQHLRVAKYNFANALFELGLMDECVASTLDLIGLLPVSWTLVTGTRSRTPPKPTVIGAANERSAVAIGHCRSKPLVAAPALRTSISWFDMAWTSHSFGSETTMAVENQSSRMATARVQPADAPRIFTGKQATV